MAKIDEVEDKLKQIEQQFNFKQLEQKTKSEESEKQIKENNDKILKLLLISQELVNQGKTHKEILDEVKKNQSESKTVLVDIGINKVKMSYEEAIIYILNKINPDKQIHKWSTRLKEISYIVFFIMFIIYLIFQLLIIKNQNVESQSIVKILELLKN